MTSVLANCKKTVILDIVEKCIGEYIKLFGDQLFMEPTGGIEKTRHQDSPYFPITTMNLISCWIALDNVNEELLSNSGVWVY